MTLTSLYESPVESPVSPWHCASGFHELGGGNWTGGQVFDGGTQIAYISYNGRAWTPNFETEIPL